MDEERDASDAEAGDDDRETAYDLLQRGQALLERRHFAQAAIVLERADRQEPAKGSILEALGRAYFNSGQPERARLTFEALLDLDPSSHYAHYAIGQSLKRLGRTDRARTHLRLAVALSPRTALYAGALARMPAEGDADKTAPGDADKTAEGDADRTAAGDATRTDETPDSAATGATDKPAATDDPSRG